MAHVVAVIASTACQCRRAWAGRDLSPLLAGTRRFILPGKGACASADLSDRSDTCNRRHKEPGLLVNVDVDVTTCQAGGRT